MTHGAKTVACQRCDHNLAYSHGRMIDGYCQSCPDCRIRYQSRPATPAAEAQTHEPLSVMDVPDSWTCPGEVSEHWPERAWREDGALWVECGHCGHVAVSDECDGPCCAR